MAVIFIIDNDVQIRNMLRQMFESEGYGVMEAPNGKVGMKLYREEPDDLLITEMVMPEKDGIETIRELRTEFPEVNIIAMCGGGPIDPDTYLGIAKRLGAKYAFSKPLDKAKLLAAVRELLQ